MNLLVPPLINLYPLSVVWERAGAAWFAQESTAGVRQAEMDQHDLSANAALDILPALVQVVPSPPCGMFLCVAHHAIRYNRRPVFVRAFWP